MGKLIFWTNLVFFIAVLGCNLPSIEPSTPESVDANPKASLDFFKSDVLPLFQNCTNSCHEPGGSATIFVAETQEAHDRLLGKVNFDNLQNSSLYTQPMNAHNCGTKDKCNALASEVLTVLEKWKTIRSNPNNQELETEALTIADGKKEGDDYLLSFDIGDLLTLDDPEDVALQLKLKQNENLGYSLTEASVEFDEDYDEGVYFSTIKVKINDEFLPSNDNMNNLDCAVMDDYTDILEPNKIHTFQQPNPDPAEDAISFVFKELRSHEDDDKICAKNKQLAELGEACDENDQEEKYNGGVKAIIDRGCATADCHNAGDQNPPLTTFDEVWNRKKDALRRTEADTMPPMNNTAQINFLNTGTPSNRTTLINWLNCENDDE